MPAFITVDGRRKWYGIDERNEKNDSGMKIRNKLLSPSD
jgi:hypothetical protein